MNQQQFLDTINFRIDGANLTPLPPTVEIFNEIKEHIKDLENLRDNTSENFDDVVIPDFPAYFNIL